MAKVNSAAIIVLLIIIAFSCMIVCGQDGKQFEVEFGQEWGVHDVNRTLPAVVEPGSYSTASLAGKAPSDAVILFDGSDLDQWRNSKGERAQWSIRNGTMEVTKKAGEIITKQGFGDCQLHIEWAAPEKVSGDGQGRGNSGVYLMGLYEVQVLDSYDNITYADGQAGAVYGQYPPLVNASRPPGEWQSYDIIFHRPRFNESGELLARANMTVLHNGVLVQDNVLLTGPTAWKARPGYKPHAEKLPISLQDHGNPVRYRNIWIRELE